MRGNISWRRHHGAVGVILRFLKKVQKRGYARADELLTETFNACQQYRGQGHGNMDRVELDTSFVYM